MAETIESMSYCELRQRARELAREERTHRSRVRYHDRYSSEYHHDRAGAEMQLAADCRRERARIERRLTRMERIAAAYAAVGESIDERRAKLEGN